MSWLVLPYSGGKKRWWAWGIAGVWTWVPWAIGEVAQVSGRWHFGTALWYFLLVGVILWATLTVGDWARHARRP